jgi:hypothetical protein
MNGKFFKQALDGLRIVCPEADTVSIEIRKRGAPIMIRPGSDGAFQNLIMPVAIRH